MRIGRIGELILLHVFVAYAHAFYLQRMLLPSPRTVLAARVVAEVADYKLCNCVRDCRRYKEDEYLFVFAFE